MPDAKDDFHLLYQLLGEHKKLALAVSGGSDSTALMLLAADWARQNNRQNDIHVLTVDHALRRNSHKEAKQVYRAAKALGLPCHILIWQHQGQTSKIQETARRNRYKLMGEWCNANGFAGIITAHNSDDQAETMLMRLARGSGVDGLSAMNARSQLFGATVYRPLLDVSKHQLKKVVTNAGHDWIEDPSNQNEKFERIRVRSAMAAIEKSGIELSAINLSTKRLKRASSALETITDQFMTTSVTVYNTGHCEIDRKALQTLPDEIAIRTLTRLLEWAGGANEPVRMAKTERLFETLRSSNTEKHTLGGAHLAVRKNSLLIGREFGRITPDLRVGVREWDNRFTFTSRQNVQPYGLLIDHDDRDRPPQLPYFVACSLPAFLNDDKTITIPHLDFTDAGAVKLSSMPKGITTTPDLILSER